MAKSKKSQRKTRKVSTDPCKMAEESVSYLIDLHKLQGVVLTNLRSEIGRIEKK